MFLGVFPGWVGDLLSIAGPALGLPALLLYILTQKNANRKLNVEEGGLEVTEFESLRAAYKEDRMEADHENAILREDINALRDDLETFRDLVRVLRLLFCKVVIRAEIRLTAEEEQEFEATRPPVRRRKPTA